MTVVCRALSMKIYISGRLVEILLDYKEKFVGVQKKSLT